ncbi:MAG TPA: pyridoxal phosphate-dependent aminotransferase [Chitinophagales bacterium]|nr:pyridoxal phosphate-dependent aminotransferase [Chitinophagales bacterium]HNL84587.1 pyridoxal phosphate-dependent aminotransferase [Chitinophagales bacterium]
MLYKRMPIEVESPEEMGYSTILYNLAESSVRDVYFKDLKLDLNELFLCYGEHRGDIKLRKAIVKSEKDLNENHVLVCPSAATALFIVSTTLLTERDHLIVLRPNYATNIETPRAISCEMDIVDLYFENGYALSADVILSRIKPNTKLISLTTPHNPTGVVLDDTVVKEIIDVARSKNVIVLVDETYRFLNFQSDLIPYYAAYADNVMSVCSLSKAHGVPGIRTGWLLCKNEQLMYSFLAAKEQVIITNSVVDEAIALHILQQNEDYLKPVHAHIRNNFSIIKTWMKEHEFLDWVEPGAGVVAFPRIKNAKMLDLKKFYTLLYENYKTLVGAGHWFEQSDACFRLGFGYPSKEELIQGLENIDNALRDSVL